MNKYTIPLDDELTILANDAWGKTQSHKLVIFTKSDEKIPLNARPLAMSNTPVTGEKYIF